MEDEELCSRQAGFGTAMEDKTSKIFKKRKEDDETDGADG